MTSFLTKTAALTALIALGSFMSGSAQAGVLRTADGTPVTTADGGYVLTGTDGADDSCDAAKEAAPKVERDHEKVVYFDFNKSTLSGHAKHHLDHLVRKFHAHTVKGTTDQTVTVVGFADRMGNAAYNEKLAMKRAQAVHDYLLSKGIKAKKIEVRSLGKTEPKADCPADLPRAKMIECLSEDRRVEIEFGASK